MIELLLSILLMFQANIPHVFTDCRVSDVRKVYVGDVWPSKPGVTSAGYMVSVEQIDRELWRCYFDRTKGRYKGQLVIQTDKSSGKLKTNNYVIIYNYDK